MKSRLFKILATAFIPLFFASSVYAHTGISPPKLYHSAKEESKSLIDTFNKGSDCKIEFSTLPIDGKYKVYQIICANGFKAFNPDGDEKIDEICWKYQGKLSCLFRKDAKEKDVEEWFVPWDNSIKKDGAINQYLERIEEQNSPQ